MLLEAMLAALVYSAYKKSGDKGVMTPERERMYRSALDNLLDPDDLRKLADAYEKEGLSVEASMLRKRADLRGAPVAVKRARREAYDKAMKSDNVEAIERMADAYESMTATGSAEALRKHAADVRYQLAGRPSDAAASELGEAQVTVEAAPSSEPELPKEEESEVVETKANGSHVEVQNHRPRRSARVEPGE